MPARKAAAKPKAEAEEVKPAAVKKQAPSKKKPAVKKAAEQKPKPAVKKAASKPEPEAMTEIFIPPALVEVFVVGKSPLVLANKMVYPGERHVAMWLHFAEVAKARPGELKFRVGPGEAWISEIPE